MSRVLPLLLLLAAPVAHATGMLGSDAPTRIPVPAEVFRAQVTDQSGVQVDLTRFTFDGEVFLYGTLGEGQAAIPFSRVAELRVEPTGEADTRILWVKLLDGNGARVVVPSDKPFYGEAVFGNYKVEAKDVSRVVFVR